MCNANVITIIIIIIMIIIIAIIIMIKIIIMTNRKYWVHVQQGIVSSHGERNPLKPWLAFFLEMVSQ